MPIGSVVMVIARTAPGVWKPLGIPAVGVAENGRGVVPEGDGAGAAGAIDAAVLRQARVVDAELHGVAAGLDRGVVPDLPLVFEVVPVREAAAR